MTLGEKIQRLRKQHGLSQEALAERIMVTRQTISKWELNQSMPDLDFIAQIGDIFNVSTDYLIKEEMVEPDELPVKKRSFRLSEKSRRILSVSISAAAIIAMGACLICDYFTADKLSWSLIAAASIIAGWLILLPCLTAKTKPVLKTLITASIVPIPLLAALSWLLRKPVIFTLGACEALIAVAELWAMYGIFRKYKARLLWAFAFSMILLIPIPILINHVAAWFLQQRQHDFSSDIFNSAITLLLAFFCFFLDYLRGKKSDDMDRK